MFAKLSERVAAVVRWMLVFGWIVITASLFYDPWTYAFNEPDNISSPFRLNREANHLEGEEMDWACPVAVQSEIGETVDWQGYSEGECDPRCTRVQGACVIERSYPMGARFFWTMALPLLPLFFLVFGHEAWRRICPLSAVNQIPRRLGIQRSKKFLNPRTGRVERSLHLIRADGWLGRNFWFLQFFLLCLGVTVRLLFINSDRTAFGIFFLSVMIIAVVVGYLFGGKTWCQYICPLSPVQKAYTEPRGLLESNAHESKTRLSQAMCRRVDADGIEVSSCVGCIAPCPDINLEQQYWSKLDQPGRRFFYYGYVGMILGFYSYYTAYAGNWDYYFSGAWTHEETQLAQLTAPGFYWNGVAMGPPKWLAAPLFIAACVFAAYAVGRVLEGLWVALRAVRQRPLTDEERLHKCYTIAAFIAINCFYFFGGRPNINLLPSFGQTMVDLGIVCTTALWAGRTYSRTSDGFARESVAGGLRRQLGKLPIDFSNVLQGRSIEQLTTDEVYVIAKTLPAMTTDQRRNAYKETLRDAMERGLAETPAGAAMLQQVQEQLEISEDEHEELLADLGMEGALLNPEHIVEQETRWRIDGYRESVTSLVTRLVEGGTPMREVLAKDDVRNEIARLQGAYGVTDEEHQLVMENLSGSQGLLVRKADVIVAELERLDAFGAGLALIEERSPSIPLLRDLIDDRRKEELTRGFKVLSALGGSIDAHMIAAKFAATAPAACAEVLGEVRWHDGRDRSWREILDQGTTAELDLQIDAYLDVERTLAPLDMSTEQGRNAVADVVTNSEPVARAAALAVLRDLDEGRAQKLAREVVAAPETVDWLLTQTALSIAGGRSLTDGPLEVVSRLHTASLFHRVPPSLLARLARDAETFHLAEGDVFCRQGEPSREVFCLCEGEARVFVNDVQVGRVVAGETVGELSLLTNHPRSATVAAAVDGTVVLKIDGHAFERFLERDARDVLRVVSERLVSTLQQLHA